MFVCVWVSGCEWVCRSTRFCCGSTPVPSKSSNFWLCWTSTLQHHPTTTPPRVSCVGSQIGPPSRPLVATAAGLPGMPQWPFLRPHCPAATYPRATRCGSSQPTPCDSISASKTGPKHYCCLGPCPTPLWAG